MRIRLFLLTITGSILCSTAVGQITLRGRIIDGVTLQPIAFANLSLKDGRTGTTTEIEGNFTLAISSGYTDSYPTS